jgi:hypothetical protein
MSQSKKRPDLSYRLRLVVPKTDEEFDRMEDAYSYTFETTHDAVGKDGKTQDEDDDGQEVDPWRDVAISILQSSALTSTREKGPLWSTQALLSSTSSTFDPDRSPLMIKFYKSIGVDPDKDDKTNQQNDSNETSAASPSSGRPIIRDDIDNPDLSSLRLGQHRRYLQLQREQSVRRAYAYQNNQKLAQQKELKTLHKQVVAEQERYRQALDRFHDKYRSRYLIGFSDSNSHQESHYQRRLCVYSQWAYHRMTTISEQQWKTQWTDNDLPHEQLVPKAYGQTRQIISLSNPTTTTTLPSNTYQQQRQTNLWLNVDDLKFDQVMLEKDQLQVSSSLSLLTGIHIQLLESLAVGTTVPPPPPSHAKTDVQTLLRNDSIALELAVRNSCRIVTTIETLEEMLHLPGESSTDWMVTTTTTHESNVTILDLPVIRPFSSPRACLEYSFLQSLYGMCNEGKAKPQTIPGSSSEDSTRYQYYVFVLPSINPTTINRSLHGQQKSIRILVRAPSRLIDETIQQPVILQAHIEYFSDQGRQKEIMDSYERSIMVLRLALFGPDNAQSYLVRINPIDCQIAAVDYMSMSSLINTPPGYPSMNPLPHLQNMIQILHSIPTLDAADSILCLPGRRTDTNNNSAGAKDSSSLSNHQQQQIRLDPYSITVHRGLRPDRQTEKAVAVPPATVDLESVLEQAGTVRLGESALKSCRRDWEWHHEGQIPQTFPLKFG